MTLSFCVKRLRIVGRFLVHIANATMIGIPKPAVAVWVAIPKAPITGHAQPFTRARCCYNRQTLETVDEQRLRKIEELFHAAQALAPNARTDFLKAHCPSDDSFRADVESMLDQPTGIPDYPARCGLDHPGIVGSGFGRAAGRQALPGHAIRQGRHAARGDHSARHAPGTFGLHRSPTSYSRASVSRRSRPSSSISESPACGMRQHQRRAGPRRFREVGSTWRRSSSKADLPHFRCKVDFVKDVPPILRAIT